MNSSKAFNLKIRGATWKLYDTGRLQISVGQSYHEDDAFRQMCSWTAQNFNRTIVCVNDTLQRHNGKNEDGAAWIQRNKTSLALLPQLEIIRWDYWLNHPHYTERKKDMSRLYAQDTTIRKNVDEEILAFAARKKPKDMLDFSLRSRAYLLEECAAFQIMFQETKAADLYPGSSLLPCRLFKGEPGKGFTKLEWRNHDSALQTA